MKKLISLIFLFSLVAIQVQAATVVKRPSYFDLEGRSVFESRKDVNTLLKPLKKQRDSKAEIKNKKEFVDYLVKDVTGLGDAGRSLVFFIVYGTPSTQRLGIAERSGVLNSFKNAFSKIPLSNGDWSEVIRIANGTRPVSVNAQAEQKAKTEFRKAYVREPVLKGDEVAIYIIAYGIRPIAKDVKREQLALKRFKSIYGFEPVYGYHWDVVRALAYSGVK